MKNTNKNKGLETSKTFDAIYEIEMVKEEEKAERENRAPDYESVTNKAYDLAYENGGLCTLAADTSTGVYNSEIPTDADVLDGPLFLRCLEDLKDGETIYGLVDHETASKIEQEYGIV